MFDCVILSVSPCGILPILSNGVVFQRHYRPSEQCSQVANPRDFSMCHSHSVTICSTLIVTHVILSACIMWSASPSSILSYCQPVPCGQRHPVPSCHTVSLYHVVSVTQYHPVTILSVSSCFIMVMVSISLCVRRLVPHVCHVEVVSYCHL